jgi:hypothetical protein
MMRIRRRLRRVAKILQNKRVLVRDTPEPVTTGRTGSLTHVLKKGGDSE